MASIWLGAGYHASNVTANSSTRYISLGNSGVFHTHTAELRSQIACRVPGTVSNLRARVQTNTQTTNATVRFRKNTADASPTFTITAATSGTFEDTSNSVALADGDLYCVRLTTGTDGTTMHLGYLYCDYAITGTTKEHNCAGNIAGNLSTASATRFDRICSTISPDVTEANRDSRWRAGTATNFFVAVGANARTTTTTFRLRINGANGNGTVSAGSGVTGLLEDTTNSDTIAAGDLLNQSSVTGTGTGTLTYGTTGFLFEQTDHKQFAIAGGAFGHTTTFYAPFLGGNLDGTTETDFQFPIPLARNITDFFVNITSNSSTTTTTARSRVNGANGNLTVSILAAATGVHSDTSNTDSVSAGDLINYQFTGNNAFINTSTVSSFITEAAAGGNLFVNLAGSGGLAGMGGLAGQGGGLAG